LRGTGESHVHEFAIPELLGPSFVGRVMESLQASMPRELIRHVQLFDRSYWMPGGPAESPKPRR
jgi:hypothetical protein